MKKPVKEDSQEIGGRAFEEAKKLNMAYIIEDGWIVRVYADSHREKIKKIEQ